MSDGKRQAEHRDRALAKRHRKGNQELRELWDEDLDREYDEYERELDFERWLKKRRPDEDAQ